MRIAIPFRGAMTGSCLAALAAAGLAAAAPAPAQAQRAPAQQDDGAPDGEITLSAGTGRLVRLDAPISDLFVANSSIADIQVRSPRELYVFGKASGETTLYATDKAGRTVYSATVRVGNNIAGIDDMLRAAMPQSSIQVMPMNGFVLLTGTVAAPADVEDATRLVEAFVGESTQVISRLRTATPLQVMLQVRIAEVSRSLVKDVGFNLLSRDTSGGFLFGVGRGTPGTILTNITDAVVPGTGALPGETSTAIANREGATTLAFAGRALGLDLLATLDLAENSGLSTTLAEPTLTALSGETASFLAGGEFPVPVASGINGTSVEFKEYGVSLAFSPTVLDGGRISMRVRPEVSEISSQGAVRLSGFEVPALTTRRAETTVELGSGQSFMIGGLLRNSSGNQVEKAPFLGDLPILGALFRSTSFRRNETELVIIVTPYLVRPTTASQIALPTDGFRTPGDAGRLLLDQRHSSRSGEVPPQPRTASPAAGPALGPAAAAVPAALPAASPPSGARPGFGL